MSLCKSLGSETYEALEKIAFRKTKPFCYSCYRKVEKQYCATCGSDDNMRLSEGVGVEWGTSWVIEHLISENCAPVDSSYAEQSLRDCYPETVQVGWIEVDPIEIIKEHYPLDFRLACDEYLDSLRADGEIIEVGGGDYWKDDIIDFIGQSDEL